MHGVWKMKQLHYSPRPISSRQLTTEILGSECIRAEPGALGIGSIADS